MRYLSAKDLLGLISPATLIEALEQALRDFAAHRQCSYPQSVGSGMPILRG